MCGECSFLVIGLSQAEEQATANDANGREWQRGGSRGVHPSRARRAIRAIRGSILSGGGRPVTGFSFGIERLGASTGGEARPPGQAR